MHDVGFDEQPGTVTDSGDGLAGFEEGADEVDGGGNGAELVGIGDAAGEKERVEVIGASAAEYGVDFDVGGGRVVVEAFDGAGLQGDDFGCGTRGVESFARLDELDLLDAIGREDRDALAGECVCGHGKNS